jgi:O-antigen/teichoic acid export membrane protein
MMREKIAQLGKDTAIYGLSTILGRLINFLIVPFYANVLLPAENGVISNIYAYIAFAFVIYCYGMEAAYMRFVSTLDSGDKKQNFSVPFLSLLGTSLLLSLAIHFQAPALAHMIGLNAADCNLVRYAGWILCFDTLAVIPFASLRMERKAKIFASLKLFNIVVNVVLNLVFILGFHFRTEGVFLANLCASVATCALATAVVAKNITWKLPKGLYSQILKFGLPYIPAGLAGMAMQVIDRPIVKALTNDATLGIYQLNYRLGIFMMLIVGMFDYAWRPFFLNHAHDEDAKKLFSKVFTYFTLGMMVIFLTVSLFIDDIVRMKIAGRQFFPPVYWQGTPIVPWVLLAYVFTGAYTCFVVGVYLEKKTKYLPFVTGAGALVNVGANFLLIPRLGILGAALSTLFSYIVMAVGMYFASQKYYRIEYEWSAIIKMTVSAFLLFILSKNLGLEPLQMSSLIVKMLLLGTFGILLMATHVVKKTDILTSVTMLKNLIKKPS